MWWSAFLFQGNLLTNGLTVDYSVISLNEHSTKQVDCVLAFKDVTDFHIDSILKHEFLFPSVTVCLILVVNVCIRGVKVE